MDLYQNEVTSNLNHTKHEGSPLWCTIKELGANQPEMQECVPYYNKSNGEPGELIFSHKPTEANHHCPYSIKYRLIIRYCSHDHIEVLEQMIPSHSYNAQVFHSLEEATRFVSRVGQRMFKVKLWIADDAPHTNHSHPADNLFLESR